MKNRLTLGWLGPTGHVHVCMYIYIYTYVQLRSISQIFSQELKWRTARSLSCCIFNELSRYTSTKTNISPENHWLNKMIFRFETLTSWRHINFPGASWFWIKEIWYMCGAIIAKAWNWSCNLEVDTLPILYPRDWWKSDPFVWKVLDMDWDHPPKKRGVSIFYMNIQKKIHISNLLTPLYFPWPFTPKIVDEYVYL